MKSIRKFRDAPAVRVVVATDENYAMPAAVTLRSVRDSLDPNLSLEICVIVHEVTESTRRRLEESVLGAGVSVRWALIGAAELDPFATVSGLDKGHSPTVWAPVALGRLLPQEWDRVIYLDCDVLALRDLGELWRVQLDGKIVGAVKDAVMPTVGSEHGIAAWKHLGLDPDLPFFNSGVMLVDLEAWRAADIDRQAYEYVSRSHGKLNQYDQEVLNAVLVHNWLQLDPRWNVVGRWRYQENRVGPYADILETARIYHFAGRGKPWESSPRRAPFLADFYSTLDRTSWCGWRPSAATDLEASG